MSLYLATGSATTELIEHEVSELLFAAFAKLGNRKRVWRFRQIFHGFIPWRVT